MRSILKWMIALGMVADGQGDPVISIVAFKTGTCLQHIYEKLFDKGRSIVRGLPCAGPKARLEQQWQWKEDGTIVSMFNSRLCLNYAVGEGRRVYMHSCHGDKNQLWTWHASDLSIRNSWDQSKCLDMSGALLKMSPCSSARPEQQFLEFSKVPALLQNRTAVVISSRGLCLEELEGRRVVVVGGRTCEGPKAQLEQQWQWKEDGTIVSMFNSRLCLDYAVGEDRRVYMHPCHGDENQGWTWHSSDLTIRSPRDQSKCLDMSGPLLRVSPCHPLRFVHPDQQFHMEAFQLSTVQQMSLFATMTWDVLEEIETADAKTLRFGKKAAGDEALLEEIRTTLVRLVKKAEEEQKLLGEIRITGAETAQDENLLDDIRMTFVRLVKKAEEEQLREIPTTGAETLRFAKKAAEDQDLLEEIRTVRLEKKTQEERGEIRTTGAETLRFAKKAADENLLDEMRTIAKEWRESGPAGNGYGIQIAAIGISVIGVMTALQKQYDSRKAVEQHLDCPRDTTRTEIITAIDPHHAEDSSSSSTECSWIDVTAGQSCCFLPDTYLKMVTDAGHEDVPAQRLFEGARVVAADGTEIEVLRPPEQHRVDAVIELRAGTSCLVVSPDHRILIPGAGNKTVQAKDLDVGSEVNLDGSVAKLTSSEKKDGPTIVLKISFRPDLPVAAFMRSPALPAILSMGSRERPPVRRAARRRGQGQDSQTIPDTEPPLTP